MGSTAIRLIGVTKSYKLYKKNNDRLKEALHPFGKKFHTPFNAVQDVNLQIFKGEILGVVGRNGSGKSTLLKLISRVLQPNKGVVDVEGKVSALLELGSGFNPQFTGLQNIFFYATILGLSKADITGKLDEIIKFADIGEYLDQPLKTYSSGMKSRLAFAVAVHVEPEILILDEVLAVGDVVFKRKCYAKMEEFFQSGKTIIYVSHDANSINQMCTRAIFLDQGRVIMDGTPKLVTAYYQKYMFASTENIDAVRAEILQVANGEQVQEAAGLKRLKPPRYLENLIPKSRLEYRNRDVQISNEMIFDAEKCKVNVLEYGESYTFEVEVHFGISATKVAFGLEIKDIKGVLITSIESAQLHRMAKSISCVNKSDVYKIKYQFPCLLNTGAYLINFGVSSYANKQEVLNRIVDIYMFKVENDQQYSAGFVQIVGHMLVSSSSQSEDATLVKNESIL